MPTTHVDQTFCSGAPNKVCNRKESLSASQHVIKKAKWAESQGYDAVVIDCSSEPGVREAKRIVNIPVIGTKESSLAIASLVSKRASSVYPKKIPVLELEKNLELTYRELLKQCRKEVKKGAVLLIPDCNILEQFAQRLQNDLDVPVLMNRDMALKLAEMLAAFSVPYTRRQSLKLSTKIGWIGHKLSKKISRFAFLIKWYIT